MNPSESHSDEAHYTSRSRLLGRALYSKKSRSAVPDAAVPVAVPVSDASYSTSDSDDEAAPFPLPASQIQDYPTEQRQQQDKWSKTFNFFERYVCVVSETGLQCGGPDDVWEQDDNDNINQDNVVTVVRNNDESSVTETPPALDQQHKKKKTVRWNLESLACHSTTVDDFYDRYMLVVSEVGLQCHPHAHDAGETKQADDDNNGTVPAATRNQRRSKTSGAAGSAGGTNQEPDTWDLQNNPCVQYTQGFSLSKLWNSLVSDTNSNTDDADTATRDLTDEITISTKVKTN